MSQNVLYQSTNQIYQFQTLGAAWLSARPAIIVQQWLAVTVVVASATNVAALSARMIDYIFIISLFHWDYKETFKTLSCLLYFYSDIGSVVPLASFTVESRITVGTYTLVTIDDTNARAVVLTWQRGAVVTGIWKTQSCDRLVQVRLAIDYSPLLSCRSVYLPIIRYTDPYHVLFSVS